VIKCERNKIHTNISIGYSGIILTSSYTPLLLTRNTPFKTLLDITSILEPSKEKNSEY